MDNLARPESEGSFGTTLARFVETEGSADIVAPLFKFLDDSSLKNDLRSPVKVTRAALIADIAHFMCVSHGRLPGVVDHAATKMVEDDARSWLLGCIEAFASERGYLNQLAVAAGPIQRMVGQDKITAILANQAKSFEMLATSDRNGCPAGTAIAFILDWQSTRPLLDLIALAMNLEPRQQRFPTQAECQDIANKLGNDGVKKRAMYFGAEQLVGQQRGLWKLIAARHTEMLHRT